MHRLGILLEVTVFLAIAVTKTRQQDNFYFDPAPIDQDIVEGDEIRLRCDVSNRKHIQFYWTLEEREVANTSRRFQEDSDLRILHVDRLQDGGSFRCIATNVTTGVSLQSTEAKLNILWIDKTSEVELKTPKTEAEIVVGSTVLLRCQAEGNREPEVEWYRNKIRLFADEERIRFHKNRLKMMDVTATDNGVYSCKARNLAGQVESTGNFLLNVPDEEAAHLNVNTFTKVLLVKEGGTARLNCQYNNALVTEWYFRMQDRRLLNSTSDKITIYNNGTLVVTDVQKENTGGYRCVGISDRGPDQQFVADIILAYLDEFKPENFEPPIPAQGQPLVVPEGHKLEVRCLPPDGLPKPHVRWEGPAGELPVTGRVRSQDGVVSISSTQASDSATYTCTLENMAAVRQRSVWVAVSVQPKIVRAPLSDRVAEGQTASFDCQVEGTVYPVTKITWRKVDDRLNLDDPRFLVDEERGTLNILNVHLSDKGNYACLVNTTGHPVITSTNAHLYVEKKLKFRPEPVNTKLELSYTETVPCKADGLSPPTVKWLHEGSDDFPEHVEDQNGILVFTGVQHSDKGYYTCIASNTQGVINATIYIDVVMKPQFKVKPQNTTAHEGYPIMLHCVVIGDPQPTINWDKNLQMNNFDQNRVKQYANGSLYISEVYMEDMGKYGCTAGNAGGLERVEIYLNVQGIGYGNQGPGQSGLPVPGVPGSPGGSGGGRGGEGQEEEQEDDADKNFDMMKTVIIAVCSAVAYLAIVIGLTVYCSIRLVKAKNLRKQKQEEEHDKAENGTVPTEHTELMEKKERDSSVLKSDDARSHVSGVSSHPSHSSHSQASSRARGLERLAYPRHNLQTLGMLGKGHYGDVFLAKAHNIREGEPETLVVVKSLLSREEHHHFEFRREMELLSKLNIEQVTRLLGVCREMEPQFLITEYCDWGDLKQFLWATRKDNGKRNIKIAPLTLAQKVSMCNQVALGMEHIANHRFVHKDLAARNILLSSSLDVKVASLALCRDVYASEYFPVQQQLLPVRWMAPECILEGEYSTKSDVWAFGVFIWEVFTLADLPYKGVSDEDIWKGQKMLEFRLDAPAGCPHELLQVIESCTMESPAARPSFSELVLTIGDITVDSDV